MAENEAEKWNNLTTVEVPQLKPGKTEADIPEAIRNVVEESIGKENPLRVQLGSQARAEDFVRLARLYCRLRTAGALTFRATIQPDGISVHYKATVKDVPAENGQAPAKGKAAAK